MFPLTGLAITLIIQQQDISSVETTILVSRSNVNVRVNQTFAVNIDVSGVSDLYGWAFKLGYNTSTLELVNVAEGSFLNNSRDTYFVSKVMSTDGYILVGCTSLGNIAGVNGNGTIASIEFRSLSMGNCTLDLYDTKLVSSNRQLMSHVATGGVVFVTIQGDVTGSNGYPDFKVDMRDIGAICSKFGATPPSPKWDPNYDINDDGIINMRDIGIACSNFGKHYP